MRGFAASDTVNMCLFGLLVLVWRSVLGCISSFRPAADLEDLPSKHLTARSGLLQYGGVWDAADTACDSKVDDPWLVGHLFFGLFVCTSRRRGPCE